MVAFGSFCSVNVAASSIAFSACINFACLCAKDLSIASFDVKFWKSSGPNNKKIPEIVMQNKINILYEDFLRKNYKIIINEKQLNNYLKNI